MSDKKGGRCKGVGGKGEWEVREVGEGGGTLGKVG